MENFEDVKVGDKVICNSNGFYAKSIVDIVVKVTAKQFVTKRGNRYKKSDGYEIGGRDTCIHGTEENIKKIEHENYVEALRSKAYRFFNSPKVEKLTDADLEAISNIIDRYK